MAQTNEHRFPTLTPGNSGYARGCRCEACVLGERAYRRLYSETTNARRREKRQQEPEFAERQREHSRRSAKKRRQDPEIRKKIDVAVKENVRRKQEFLDEIKLEQGCIDCAYAHDAIALDFDHVRGEKQMDLSNTRYHSVDAMVEELAKCEVVCACCHRIRTRDRFLARKAVTDVNEQAASAQVDSDAPATDPLRQAALEELARAVEAARQAGLSVAAFVSGMPGGHEVVLGGGSKRQEVPTSRRRQNNTSGYRGVTWMPRLVKWAAQMQEDKRHVHLGVYESKHEAAFAVDVAMQWVKGVAWQAQVAHTDLPATGGRREELTRRVESLLEAKAIPRHT